MSKLTRSRREARIQREREREEIFLHQYHPNPYLPHPIHMYCEQNNGMYPQLDISISIMCTLRTAEAREVAIVFSNTSTLQSLTICLCDQFIVLGSADACSSRSGL